MSASLVGSEMCIRDSAPWAGRARQCWRRVAQGFARAEVLFLWSRRPGLARLTIGEWKGVAE
eukprot:13812780-Alexandrium_andersonii.AAC.1